MSFEKEKVIVNIAPELISISWILIHIIFFISCRSEHFIMSCGMASIME